MRVGGTVARSLLTCSCSCLGTWEDCQMLGTRRLGQLSCGVRVFSGDGRRLAEGPQTMLFLSTTDNTPDTERSGFHVDGSPRLHRHPRGPQDSAQF